MDNGVWAAIIGACATVAISMTGVIYALGKFKGVVETKMDTLKEDFAELKSDVRKHNSFMERIATIEQVQRDCGKRK